MSDFKFHSNRESTPEDETSAWAENNGWEVRLMSYRGRRGCPDRFFFGYGKIVIIEFKKEGGGQLSENQVREHKRLAKVGIKVHVVDNATAGILLLKGHSW